MSPDSPPRPVHRLLDLEQCINDAFARLIHEPWGGSPTGPLWQPPVDVRETANAYLLEADLPGVLPTDVCIRVDDHQVTLTGRRQSLSWQQSERSLRVERSVGGFSRTLTFEHEIDAPKIETQFDQGILRIRLPKRLRSGDQREPAQ